MIYFKKAHDCFSSLGKEAQNKKLKLELDAIEILVAAEDSERVIEIAKLGIGFDTGQATQNAKNFTNAIQRMNGQVGGVGAGPHRGNRFTW